MRAGLLFRTNGSMSGVGDLGRIGDGASFVSLPLRYSYINSPTMEESIS